MSGIGNDFDYFEVISSYLDPWDSQNENLESIMNFNPESDYDYNHIIFGNRIGAGSIIVVGSTFNSYTDDEARVLANAVNYLGAADFVSFEPESGTLAAGESIDVVASYESPRLEM